jgi:hypothetical protein
MTDATDQFPMCSTHGLPMTLRPLSRQSREQLWCGTWYDCPRCTGSVLLPSEELIASWRQQGFDRQGRKL